MPTDILTLRTMSTLFAAYAKSCDFSKKEQEVQGMYVDGVYVFSSNLNGAESVANDLKQGQKDNAITIGSLRPRIKDLYNNNQEVKEKIKNATALPEADPEAKSGVLSLIGTTSSSVSSLDTLLPHVEGRNAFMYSTSAEHCGKNLGKATLHVLKGDGPLKEAGEFWHAEQNLLMALIHRLNAGESPPGEILIAGLKKPCGSCLRVLRAFSSAYEIVYGKKLTFVNELGNPGTEARMLSRDDFEAGTSAMFYFKRVFQMEFEYYSKPG